MSRTQSGRAAVVVLILIVLGFAGFAGLAALRVGPAPAIDIEPGLPAIGKRTPITVEVAEPTRGLTGVRVEFVQGERVETLAERSFTPRPPWAFWGARTPSETIRVEVGRETIKGLAAGSATVRVTAERAGSWLRRPSPAVRELAMPVKLTPPALHVLSTATYVAQGGCEAVVYRVGESATAHGVRAGEWFFPGFPLPGGGREDRFALFAVPYDLADSSRVRLVAEDEVGNETQLAFVDKFFPQPVRRDTIDLNDPFLQQVVPAILSQTPEIEERGSLLDSYLAINGELRRKNNETLVELAARSRPQFLWTRPFVAMPNAKVMSAFADRRSYVYQGRVVDHQDHLGFDLASTRAAPVPAANDGIVVLARFFGIYGNAVVIDHGYGLGSLYGHLSSIDVTEGQEVRRGEPLGRTGATGLAGGDHLHFSMLLQGLPVTPKEWWDWHWIEDRIARKLGPALAFERR